MNATTNYADLIAKWTAEDRAAAEAEAKSQWYAGLLIGCLIGFGSALLAAACCIH
jgi:hypothetical protein